MPPKRRTTATRSARPPRQQATLSFHGKHNQVTKPQSPRTAGAANKKDVAFLDEASVTDEGHRTEPTTAEDAALPEPAATEAPHPAPVGDAAETQARKVAEARIQAYWSAKESRRKAPRVHQQDLSLHEKILREWDVSGQFGPCIGIARLKRWKRAEVLGLKPPIEVLAVLLRERDSGDGQSQRAHVDELMGSRGVAELQ